MRAELIQDLLVALLQGRQVLEVKLLGLAGPLRAQLLLPLQQLLLHGLRDLGGGDRVDGHLIGGPQQRVLFLLPLQADFVQQRRTVALLFVVAQGVVRAATALRDLRGVAGDHALLHHVAEPGVGQVPIVELVFVTVTEELHHVALVKELRQLQAMLGQDRPGAVARLTHSRAAPTDAHKLVGQLVQAAAEAARAGCAWLLRHRRLGFGHGVRHGVAGQSEERTRAGTLRRAPARNRFHACRDSRLPEPGKAAPVLSNLTKLNLT